MTITVKFYNKCKLVYDENGITYYGSNEKVLTEIKLEEYSGEAIFYDFETLEMELLLHPEKYNIDKKKLYVEILYNNEQIYKGEINNLANFHGKGIILGKYIGDFVDNQKNGKGTFFLSNGDKYKGQVLNNEMSGQGTMFFANGTKYEGSFKNNKANGRGIITWSDGTTYIGNFINNISKTGMIKRKNENEYKNYNHRIIFNKLSRESPKYLFNNSCTNIVVNNGSLCDCSSAKEYIEIILR